jgi:hypothetical protein
MNARKARVRRRGRVRVTPPIRTDGDGDEGLMYEGPVAFTDPGCDAGSHSMEVMAAAMAWDQVDRFPLPQVMDCGCLLWLGEEAEAEMKRRHPSWVPEDGGSAS